MSETRIASYIAIARGQVPAKLYFGTWRTFPATEDWTVARAAADRSDTGPTSGSTSTRASTSTSACKVVPGWGGSMFEALMPNMFVPEERWAPRSWGPNHRNTVAIHR